MKNLFYPKSIDYAFMGNKKEIFLVDVSSDYFTPKYNISQ